jgi:ATP-binding cassette, subfamily C (CFTR/MRP), member 1
MVAKLREAFKRRSEAGSSRPLAMAMFDTFRGEFVLGGLCCITSSVVQVISPYVLRYLIQFATDAYIAQVEGTEGPPIGRGLGLVFGVTGLQIVQSTTINHFLYRGMVVGGEARATLTSVIFDKAMKLSGRARAGGVVEAPPPEIKPGTEAERKWYQKMLRKKQKEQKKKSSPPPEGWSNGRIVNLMSTDTARIDLASGMFHLIWASPIAILVTTALLLVNLTYSALAGIGLLVLAGPVLGRAIRSLYTRRAAINKITDQRVSLTQEVLSAVRFVKYFGWEMSFLDRLSQLRKREIRSIQWLLTIRNAINAVSMTMPVFASMLAFITYSLSQHVLNPAPIFSSLALFNSMRVPLNLLPLVIGQVTDAFNSVERIQEFLQAEEAPDDVQWDYDNKNAIVVKNADFTWERTTTHADESAKPLSKKQIKAAKKAEKQMSKNPSPAATPGDSTPEVKEDLQPFKIEGIDLTIGRSELVAVIGLVGSGKSSLLAALAGDMRRTSGEVVFGASRAFCPQYAWIQNATVRDNIIFGKPFDPVWYERVIEACALRQDLEMLPNGDMTEIGERGITVSGGQKQRLNIARAIYFNADIVIMDDPLSAVDAHVGRHIFDNAMAGLLKDKCQVLATHQLHVLHRCDRIIWMKDGKIATVDTFQNLMATSEEFQHLLSSTAQEEEQTKSEKGEDEETQDEKKVVPKKKQTKGPGLMQAEERAVKSVSWSVYIAYCKASGSILVAPLVFTCLVLSQCANIATSLWLSWWTADKFGYSNGVYVSQLIPFEAVPSSRC